MATTHKILLIEDDDVDAEDVIRQLGSSREKSTLQVSFEIDLHTTLEESLARLADYEYDLVLLDINLPDSRGLENVSKVLECRSVPIVIMTSRKEIDIGLQAVRLGAQDYLIKGQFNAPLLWRIILYAIERFRFGHQLRKSESQLQFLTEQLPVVLWSTDDTLTFTSSLGGGLAGLGLQPDQIVGMHLFNYLKTDDPENPAIAAHLAALEGKSTTYEIEFGRLTYQSVVEPLWGADMKIAGTLGIALNITKEKRLQEESRWARSIQQRMLPKGSPQLPGYDIAGISKPADATGGDFFDYLNLLDGRHGFVVADVTHHGHGPALIMSATRVLVRTLAQHHEQVDRILTLANDAVWESTEPGINVTMFFGILDAQTRQFQYTAAGHPAGILHTDGSWDALPATTYPLGIDQNMSSLCSEPISLQPGEILVLLTDGFIEPRNSAREQFGINRVMQYLHQHRQCSCEQLLEKLLQEVQAFCQSEVQEDDRTGVLIKVASTDDGSPIHSS